jgi:hypothetical protein
MTHTKDEAMKLALEAAYLAGFNASGEGYNGEYPFGDWIQRPEQDKNWCAERDDFIKQALAAPVQPVACQVCGGSGFIKCDALQSREKNNGKWGRCLNCQPYTTPPAAPVLEGRDWSLLEATQESLREHMTEIKRLKEAQPAVPLTDEQIEHLWETRVSQPCPRYPLEKADWVQFARAIEAAHGITKGQP